MEKNSNRARRFIVCSVVDAGAKHFCIVIPEGRGFPRGWASLAAKLRSLGVASPAEGSIGTSSSHPSQGFFRRKREGERSLSFVEVVSAEPKRLGKSIWLHLGGEDVSFRKEPVAQWLVGSWGGGEDAVLDLKELRRWGLHSWSLDGDLNVSKLVGGF